MRAQYNLCGGDFGDSRRHFYARYAAGALTQEYRATAGSLYTMADPEIFFTWVITQIHLNSKPI